MIESIDQLRPGEYLMCSRGPTITGTDQRGNFASKVDRSFEGTVVRLLAVSPPMMLIQIFPMPCGDKTHDHSPYVTPTQFTYMGWSRPPRRYVREYMRAAQHKAPARWIPEPSRGVITGHKLHELMEDIYRTGSNPDRPLFDDRDDDGDDDEHDPATH